MPNWRVLIKIVTILTIFFSFPNAHRTPVMNITRIYAERKTWAATIIFAPIYLSISYYIEPYIIILKKFVLHLSLSE